MGTLDGTRLLAEGTMLVASVILLGYLYWYVRHMLTEVYRHGWWYLGIGVAAGGLYGAFGILEVLYSGAWISSLARGAALFFFLFLALGMRAIYNMGNLDDTRNRTFSPRWFDYLVIAVFIIGWWTGFLSDRGGWVLAVETAGWLVACMWAVIYGVRSVDVHEGTSLAALIRHLLPVIVTFSVVVIVDIVGVWTNRLDNLVPATWIVGTVLVAAFLLNTAIALRQKGAEVERIYDRTTWQEEAAD